MILNRSRLLASEESILLTVGQLGSCDAGITGKPLSVFPPNTLSLVLTEGVRESQRVAPMKPKSEVFWTPGFIFHYGAHLYGSRISRGDRYPTATEDTATSCLKQQLQTPD